MSNSAGDADNSHALEGATDGTKIGNTGDRLRVDSMPGQAAFVFGDTALAVIAQAVVRRTVYNEQTTNAQRSLSSSSLLDAAAGTGARTVQITYYDQTGAGPFAETVTLNGMTAVNTVATNICFIEHLEVLTAGTARANQGIITLHTAIAGVGVLGTIAAGNNQTFWAHHYVALGKTANITGISVSHSGTTVGSGGVFALRALTVTSPTAVEKQVSDAVRLYGQSSEVSRVYNSPIRILGPIRLLMYVTPESSTSLTFRAAFDFFEQ